MSNIPTGFPTLSRGSHLPGDGEACVMEYVALLAGEEWTDSPSCTHPVIATMARKVNDRLPNSERHRLIPLIGRLFGTAPTGTDHERQVLSVRLAAWCAREVLPLVRESGRPVAEQAIFAAEAWACGTGAKEAVHAAAANAFAAASSAANAAYFDAYAIYAAAYAADTAAYSGVYVKYAAARAAANAFANAFANASSASSDGLVTALTGLIDEYDRLTGRTQFREVTEVELAELAARVTA